MTGYRSPNCSRCDEPIPDDERKRKSGRCKSCRTAERKQWRLDHPQWRQSEESRRRNARAAVFKQHGITAELFDATLAKQEFKCALCRTDKPGGHGTWHIDHDHSCCPYVDRKSKSCGKCFRGLLCAGCNLQLGWFERNKAMIML